MGGSRMRRIKWLVGIGLSAVLALSGCSGQEKATTNNSENTLRSTSQHQRIATKSVNINK